MKKSIVMVMCLFGTMLYGMEQQIKQISFFIGSTEIKVMQCPLYDALEYNKKENVDLVCVGRKEYRMLQAPSFGDCNEVGAIFFDDSVTTNTLYYHESFSNEVCTPFSNKSDLYRTAISKEVAGPLVYIVEPTIWEEKNYSQYPVVIEKDHFYYALYTKKNMPTREKDNYETKAYGQAALTEATIDLKLCYESLLQEALGCTKNKDKSKIILSALSSQVGLPWNLAAECAVTSLLNFLEEHPQAYSFICACVYRGSEFDLYKELFAKKITALKYIKEQK